MNRLSATEKREIHLRANHQEPPPEPQVFPAMIDETENGDLAATQAPNRAICADVDLKRRRSSSSTQNRSQLAAIPQARWRSGR